jgi:serine phosphatase RsbU (regulator of sigma subunit)
VFYKPKDIVAGDFYVCEKIEGKLIIAIADCTGHGVPGAIISIICNNAIRRAIKKTGVLNAAKILDKTRDYVIQTFATSDEDIQDGMDIALCIIDPNTYELNYAGANISLHYTKQQKLVEVKSDKQPVGNYINKLPFTNHTIQLHSGDSIYLFTDGLPDQFGGADGKKFKYKQLRDLISVSTQLPLQKQESLINQAFELWKGNLPQVDDICIIGVRP